MAPPRRPRLRLLFDELYSPRVARALWELDFHAYHVGGEDQPVRGSDDDVVLDHAKKHKQIIVTYNLDMIMLCAEQGESVIWIDPKGKKLSRREMVLRAFEGVEEWDLMLRHARRPVCIRAMKTKTVAIELADASRLADQRLRKLRAREHRRKIRRGDESLEGV